MHRSNRSESSDTEPLTNSYQQRRHMSYGDQYTGVVVGVDQSWWGGRSLQWASPPFSGRRSFRITDSISPRFQPAMWMRAVSACVVPARISALCTVTRIVGRVDRFVTQGSRISKPAWWPRRALRATLPQFYARRVSHLNPRNTVSYDGVWYPSGPIIAAWVSAHVFTYQVSLRPLQVGNRFQFRSRHARAPRSFRSGGRYINHSTGLIVFLLMYHRRRRVAYRAAQLSCGFHSRGAHAASVVRSTSALSPPW